MRSTDRGATFSRITDVSHLLRANGNGTNPVDLTNAEIRGREDALVMFNAFKERVKGFEDAYLSSTGPFVGVRETRRIVGDRQLTIADIEGEAAQDDAIALGAWWLDRHPQGQSGYHLHSMVRPYDISYGTLLPQGVGKTSADLSKKLIKSARERRHAA